MRLIRLRLVVGFLFLVTFARSSDAPSTFTLKERMQGFRDAIVLAKPRADRRAVIDAEEGRRQIRAREKFSRLGALRMLETNWGEDVTTAVRRLQATGLYEFVEPDYIMAPDAEPNDSNYFVQWSLNNTGQLTGGTVGADIKAPAAWDIVHDAPSVVVAVIDNGVNANHADLAPNLWVNPAPTFGDIHGAQIIRGVRSGEIADQTGHGSHVSGIIGAAGNNGVGIAGVAWRVQLMILKNAGADGTSASSDSAACMDYAVAHGAHVINCSFGGTTFSQTLYTAIKAARDAGVIVVAAAGNAGVSNDVAPHYPSSFLLDNIIAVGNSGPTDAASSSSDYGANVELFAPGTSILSLDYTSTTGIVSKSGTSMAAPHVTGAIALLKARFPNDTYLQLINRLLRGTDLKTALAGRALTNGRLNLLRSLTTTTNRPFNDDFSARAIIGGNSLSIRANNRGATSEIGEPAPAGVSSSGSLWWLWVAPTSGAVTVTTTGSDYDTVLGIYTGTSLSLLTSLASNDNDGAKTSSSLSFNATASASYVIVVGGKNGGQGYTQLNIAVAPANDAFAAATTLTGESAQATGANTSATRESGEPQILNFPGGASMWYKWTAPKSGQFQISAFTANFDALLAVYTGTSLASLSFVAANDDTGIDIAANNTDSRCTINAVAGTTYYFQVDSKSPAVTGKFTISVTDSLWQASLGDGISSAPTIGPDGTLYVGANSPDRRFYAINPEGTLKWTYAAAGNIDISTPALAEDGALFLGTNDGKVTALNQDGTVRWQRDFGVARYASVSTGLAADGTVYVQPNDGYLYALSPLTGANKWRYDIHASQTFSSPVVAADGTVLQGSDDKNFYAINSDGTLKWKYNAGGTITSTPAIDADGNVYFGTYSTSRVISLRADGTLRWTYTNATGTVSSSPALSADSSTVYLGAGDGKLHALDSATGTARWTYNMSSLVFACSPAVDSSGVIYIGAENGKLYAINPNGTLKRTWDTAAAIRSSPTIFGSRLYFGSKDAKLYAIDIGAFVAGGPWPQYRHNVRHLGRAVIAPLAVTVNPQPHNAAVGSSVQLGFVATGQGALTYQWSRNGSAISGATSSTLMVDGVSSSVGSFTVTVSGAQGTVTSTPAIVGLDSTTKLVGPGTEVGTDIPHPVTHFTYDQILLQGAAASIRADPGQIMRVSYVDLTDDIVQVEFSGAGTFSLVLDGSSPPAPPVKYNQSATSYMRGHMNIVVSGADETTNLSVFSVGRGNAVNQALFRDDVTYDGVADIGFIAISSTNGKFGGLRTANANYVGSQGLVGVYAPGVNFDGPVFIGDIVASDTATPVIQLGSGSDVRITGGDLLQLNNQPIQVSGIAQLQFTPGSTSHNTTFPAQTNRGRLEQNGADITSQIVVYP